ncbi:AAA family ATPase [Thalassobaculum sp.]|uniref:AAA family ATPase n=1 Tax=Thalassobaculum sp. TaxID=2022740 RepID=UPI0032ED355B
MQIVAIVTGISGVGKSRLLAKVMRKSQGQLLVASDLIADELSMRGERAVSRDKLRELDITKNQRMFAAGFARRADRTTDLIVLDAHVVIDTPRGLEPMSADVFLNIGANLIVFVEDEPERILKHRIKDKTRQRPVRDLDTLREQQTLAKSVAAGIAKNLEIDFHVISSGDVAALKDVLRTPGHIR